MDLCGEITILLILLVIIRFSFQSLKHYQHHVFVPQYQRGMSRLVSMRHLLLLGLICSAAAQAQGPASQWDDCLPEINPVAATAVLQKPHRLVFVYEGYVGFAPKWAAAIRNHRDTGRAIDQSIAYPLALDFLIRQQLVRRADPDTYWFYFASHHARRSSKCIAKLAALSFAGQGGPAQFSTITLAGFSHGAKAVVEVARLLRDQHKIKVDLAFTVDPVPRVTELAGKALVQDSGERISRTENVARWINHYENTDHIVTGHPIRPDANGKEADANILYEDLGDKAHFGGGIVNAAAPNFYKEVMAVPASRSDYKFEK